jgi:23S rRNA (uracil1939-C5)-methyltransferase
MMSLRVEKLVWRGRGLAREPAGRVVLLDPGVLPGELVLARVHKEQRDVAHAAAVEIVEPSGLRRPHPCALSPECAGCMLGIAPNRHQLELKLGILRDSLARNLPGPLRDRLPPVELLACPQAWRYRHRTQVHVLGGRPHFMSLGGKRLVPLDDCLLLTRPLSHSLARLSSTLPDGRFTLAASFDGSTAATERDPVTLSFPLERYGVMFRLPAATFFQANWRMNLRLVDLAARLLPPRQRVVDLFAGAGNFALPLARLGHDVLAVEGSAQGVECGRRAADAAGIPSVRFLAADVRTGPLWEALRDFGPQAAIADPPRAGSFHITSRLLDLERLETILWVSCDVVNTCRDIAPLLRGGWKVDSLHLVDMFPQTWHMEVVFVLKKA